MNNQFALTITGSAGLPEFRKNSAMYFFILSDNNFADNCRNAAKAAGFTLAESVIAHAKETDSSINLATAGDTALHVSIIPVKKDKPVKPDFFRNQVTGIVQGHADGLYTQAVIVIPSFDAFNEVFTDEFVFVQSFAEGIHYGNYVFNAYKSDAKEPKALEVMLVSSYGRLQEAIERAGMLMECVNFTRNLQNEPASKLHPQELAEAVTNACSGLPIDVTVFDETELAVRKMGGLLAVGRGSVYPPRLITAAYKPAGAVKHVAIVGKGITFDTGGISIKPAANMGDMKGDMSGAAVAAGVVLAAAKLNLPIAVTAVIPTAENMPSGDAMRPGDILITSSGKTIEVDNTDAEGRLILADALHYTSEMKPDVIIDLATLTGACVVALGEFVAGLFTSDDTLARSLVRSSNATRELIWRMPMFDEYNQLIKSDVADVKNTGGRWGGAITAAKFLENWVDKNIAWAHIDIAGPASPHKFNNYTSTYFTGFGVRLLTDYLQALA